MTSYTKDPEAVLDYAFDWTAWLADSETITDYQVAVPADSGLTLGTSSYAPSLTGGVVTCWLSGGTIGKSARVTCHIVTDAGREDDRSITIRVYER